MAGRDTVDGLKIQEGLTTYRVELLETEKKKQAEDIGTLKERLQAVTLLLEALTKQTRKDVAEIRADVKDGTKETGMLKNELVAIKVKLATISILSGGGGGGVAAVIFKVMGG